MRQWRQKIWNCRDKWILPVGILVAALSRFSSGIFKSAPPAMAFVGGLFLVAVAPLLLMYIQRKDAEEIAKLGECFDHLTVFHENEESEELLFSDIIKQSLKDTEQAKSTLLGKRICFSARVMQWENDEIEFYGLPVNAYTKNWRRNDPYAALIQKSVHPKDVISLTGTICQMRMTFFYIDDVEELEKVVDA